MGEPLIDPSKYENMPQDVKEAFSEINENFSKELIRRSGADKKTKYGVVFLVIGIILLFYSGIIIMIGFFEFTMNYALEEKDTKEVIATVEKIQYNNYYYYIRTKEFDALIFFSNRTVIDFMELDALTVGQKIKFKIRRNSFLELNELSGRIEILALKTDNADIITLESYNGIDDGADIIPFVIGLIFLFVAIVFIALYKHQRKTFVRKNEKMIY